MQKMWNPAHVIVVFVVVAPQANLTLNEFHKARETDF